MRNILIIIISFSLLACSDENNKPDTKSEQVFDKAKASQKEPMQEIDDNNDQNKIPENKWDKIVDPYDGIISDNDEEFEEDDENQISSEDASKNDETKEILEKDVSGKEAVYTPSFTVNENDIVLGNAKSNIVVVEYFSPTCPHCSYYHKIILPELKKRYIDTNKIAYVIREFIGNKQDLDAAILERCPNNVDSFLKFQSVILSQQDKWAASNKYRELLTNIGQIGGVSAESYAKCLSDNKIVKILLGNTNLAANASNFIGTPAFFVNGQQITNGYSVESISKAIDKELQKSNAK